MDAGVVGASIATRPSLGSSFLSHHQSPTASAPFRHPLLPPPPRRSPLAPYNNLLRVAAVLRFSAPSPRFA